MAYRTQPLIGVGALAVPAGVGTVTLIAAPGAGLRLRIVGGIVSVSRLTGSCDVTVEDTALTTVLARQVGISPAGIPYVPLDIPEPGISLPVNTAAQAALNGSAVGGTFNGVLYYFVDAIT